MLLSLGFALAIRFVATQCREAPKISFDARRGAMAVAARNGVCRGAVFRRRAMMLGWPSLTHGLSHCDAHLAHVETRFAAARRAIRRS
jgi:hypothetical protein